MAQSASLTLSRRQVCVLKEALEAVKPPCGLEREYQFWYTIMRKLQQAERVMDAKSR